MHKYESQIPVYHFDLYRLKDADEFKEFFDEEAICCIEWAEKIEALLPPETLRLTFEHAADSSRVVIYE